MTSTFSGETRTRHDLFTRRHLLLAGAAASVFTFDPTGVVAQTKPVVIAHNRTAEGAQMAFTPAVTRIMPATTVQFTHADRGHNFQSFDNMLPAGAAVFEGAIGEELDITFTDEGIYGYFCKPHQMMGMIGYVLVGDFTRNLDAVRSASAALRGPMMASRVAAYMDEINAIGQAEGLM